MHSRRPKAAPPRPIEPDRICFCDECATFGGDMIETSNGSFRCKRFSSLAEYNRHKTIIERADRLRAALPSTPPELALPKPPSAVVPIPMTIDASPIQSPAPVFDISETDSWDGSYHYDKDKIERLHSRLKELEQPENAYWRDGHIEFEISPSTVEYPDNFSLELKHDHPPNSTVKGHYLWLEENLGYVQGVLERHKANPDVYFRSKAGAAKLMLVACQKLTNEDIREEWKRQWSIFWERKQERIPAERMSFLSLEPHRQVYLAVWLLATVLHLIIGVSMDNISWFLHGISLISTLFGRSKEEVERNIPKTARGVTARLQLSGHSKELVCCPRCYRLYNSDSYPEFCLNKASPQSAPCNRRLRKPRPSPNGGLPVRVYQHNDLKRWISWMYNRKDIEPALDAPLNRDPPPPDQPMRDIWDAEAILTFRDHDRKTLFKDPEDNEGRLFFNLNCDYFSAFGNRQAGKKLSVGGVYLVCLNLPPSMRYKTENMFLVGIIPGPKEPSSHQMNEVLRPLVDDLVLLWETGIYIDRTVRFQQGRSVRAALLALVCDLPAARLLAGFSHYKSSESPCSVCQNSELSNLDESTFPYRTTEEHRRLAEAWLAADSEEKRNRLYNQNGVRWSELLRLAYWDPIKNTIIDSMHCFYLRIFQRHCRDIWGMGVKLEDCDGLWEEEDPTDAEKEHALNTFCLGSDQAFGRLTLRTLKWLARRENLEIRSKGKKRFLHALKELRCARNWPEKPLEEWEEPTTEEKENYTHIFQYGSTTALKKLNLHALQFLARQEGLDVVGQRKKEIISTLQRLRNDRCWPEKHSPGLPEPATPDTSIPEIVSPDPMPPVDVANLGDLSLEPARRELENGTTREGLLEFETPILLKLVEVLGITPLTEKRKKPSRNRTHLVEALQKWRQDRAAGSSTLAHVTPPEPRTSAINTGDRTNLSVGTAQRGGEQPAGLATLTKTEINKMGVSKLRELCNALVILNRIKKRQALRREELSAAAYREIMLEDLPESDDDGDSAYYEPPDDDSDFTDRSESESETSSSSDVSAHDDDPHNARRSEDPEAEFVVPDGLGNMRAFIHKQRYNHGFTDARGKVLKSTRSRRKRAGVLGQATLAEVRADMAATVLPSWLPRAPSHPGEADHGKFSADQWRSFCTMSLPITLIRLWGQQPQGSRKFEMLSNFMHLVAAIRLANKRWMTEEMIAEYEQEIRAYLHPLERLYPHTAITPYQHLSLHFGMFLRRFGPVHSWRCFAFERYNYILQKIPHNNQMGDLEKTLFDRFCMIQKLRSVFNTEAIPDQLQPLVPAFNRVFNADIRGTRAGDAVEFDEWFHSLPEEVDWDAARSIQLDRTTYSKATLWINENASPITPPSSRVISRRRIQRLDLIFTAADYSFADAQVVYPDTSTTGWSTGSISQIFTMNWEQSGGLVNRTFAAIRPYQRLSSVDATQDPYRRFGLSGGCLFYRSHRNDIVVMPLEEIIGHNAYTPVSIAGIKGNVFHSLPQDKVSR